MAYRTRRNVARAIGERGAGERVFRVLALDGGGMRGLIPAQVLAYLERRARRPVHDLFDLVAGTSTGGLLSLALTIPRPKASEPYTAEGAIELYREERRKIFGRGPWHAIVRSGGGWWGPKYPAEGVEEVLQRRFHERTIGEALTNVLVTSYDTEASAPFFFKSWRTKRPADDPDYQDDFKAWQAARATSAAPTYFPPLQLLPLKRRVDAPRTLVDGGVFANDPAVCAYAEAVRLTRGEPATRIVLVSLGTGEFYRPDHFRALQHAGRIGWIQPLIRIVMDGMSDATQYQCDQILGEDCARFQAQGVRRELDDTSDDAVVEFTAAGQELVRERRAELDALANALAAAPRWQSAGSRPAMPSVPQTTASAPLAGAGAGASGGPGAGPDAPKVPTAH